MTRYIPPSQSLVYVLAITFPSMAILHVGGACRYFWHNIVMSLVLILITSISWLVASRTYRSYDITVAFTVSAITSAFAVIFPVIHALNFLSQFDLNGKAFAGAVPYHSKVHYGAHMQGDGPGLGTTAYHPIVAGIPPSITRYVRPAPWLLYVIAVIIPPVAILEIGGACLHFWINVAVDLGLISVASVIWPMWSYRMRYDPAMLIIPIVLVVIVPMIHALVFLNKFDLEGRKAYGEPYGQPWMQDVRGPGMAPGHLPVGVPQQAWSSGMSQSQVGPQAPSGMPVQNATTSAPWTNPPTYKENLG